MRASQVVLVVKNPPANAGDLGNSGSIPESGMSPGGGHSNPVQYSCLKNSMDRGTWWAAVHRVSQSRKWLKLLLFSSVAQSYPTLQPNGLQYAKIPCPSPTPGPYSNSCPSSWWCHPTISSSFIPFSSHLHSFPASGYFPASQFVSGGQSIGVSALASVLPMNIQDL